MNYNEYKKLLEQYEEQQKIELYQQSRALRVPKTRKSVVVIHGLLLILILGIIIHVAVIAPLHLWIKLSGGFFLCLNVLEFYLKFIGIKVVECYQHYASEETRRRCLCVPSCSEYAILCLKKYELIMALLKIRKRLYVTCQGEDYKIDWP